jgi:hypothetical protein
LKAFTDFPDSFSCRQTNTQDLSSFIWNCQISNISLGQIKPKAWQSMNTSQMVPSSIKKDHSWEHPKKHEAQATPDLPRVICPLAHADPQLT